ncbi:hypothetical protein JNW91_10000 [Micromonospora sp. STR1_7]|uniref:Integral membrane protein n=1 Tax=Micromonospora parastrephiae TaxID=2806101 RepID=A0ABS1XSE0_9ACTN|nr:hypothetical protein [Micromonospora parastrephiae]MBM0232166.1 hypothetical protein [Micromonospora parastrephiae]
MTVADPGGRPSRQVSTTRRTLLRLRAALLAATAVALVACLAVFLGVARTADAAADRSVPAILAVYDAQHALRSAHAAAVRNLADGGLVLGGPGVDYQRQIAGAGQYLTLVAENNAAGDDGTRDIQTVEALLVTYTGLIEQADARYRDASLRALGVAALRDAASLMDDILGLLDELLAKQVSVLDEQRDNGWTHRLTPAVWLLPLVVLGALLVPTQIYLSRRFRRALNLPLLLATAATVGMVALTSLSLRSAADLDQIRRDVAAVNESRQGQFHQVRHEAADGLADEVQKQCPEACARTVAGLRASAPPPSPPASAASTPARGAETETLTHAARAADSNSVEFVLPLLAFGIGVLILAGFQPRLAEYGYRST